MRPLLRCLARIPGAALALGVLRGGDARTSALLALSRPEGLFQPHGTTLEDRYPRVFRLARAELGDGPGLRLLSFGCSTGEEVFTLRRYFPRAHVTGIDISRERIATCRARLAAMGGDDGIAFRVAGSARHEPPDHYDAAFAMAVFRHGALGAMPPACGHVLRFERFGREAAALASCLRPGGLLAICHSNFRFADTAASACFEAVLQVPQDPRTPIYGPDNRRLDGVRREAVLFRKAGPATGAPPAP